MNPKKVLLVSMAVVLNLAAVAAYIWALADYTTVTVRVEGSKLTATVNDKSLSVVDATYPTGKVGLALEDYHSYRASSPSPPSTSGFRRQLEDIGGWIVQSNAPSAWAEVRITGPEAGDFQSDFRRKATFGWAQQKGIWDTNYLAEYRPAGSGSTLTGKSDWKDYVVEARLARGKEFAGVLVRARGSAATYMFWLRPEHGDMGWDLLREGQPLKELSVDRYRMTFLSGVKALLREVLWSYFLGLAVLALVMLLSLPLAFLSALVAKLGAKWQESRLSSFEEGGPEGVLPSATSLPHGIPFDLPVAMLRAGSDLPEADEVAGSLPKRDVSFRLRRFASQVASFRLPRLEVSSSQMAVAIAILGTSAAATVATVLLGRIPHVQDDVTYLFQAQTLALGRFSVPAPPLPEFFAQEFLVVHGGEWFGKYPPGHPLVLAIGVLLGVPWLVLPVLGGLSLFLVYLTGRSLYGARIGLLASLLGLLSPFFIFMSGSFMAHPTGLFFTCLFLWAFVKMTQSKDLLWAVLAGLALGFAAITRVFTAMSLSLPFALYFLYLFARDMRGYARKAVVLLAGATLPLTFLFIYNWSLTGDPFADTYQLYWFFDKIGFGREFGGAGGHTLETGLRNTWGNLTTLQFHLFGWPAYLTLAFLLLPFATLRASRWDWMFLSSFLLLMASYAFYWADGIMYGPRYYYESLPMLLLLTARGFSLLPEMAQRLWAPSAIGNQHSSLSTHQLAISNQQSAISNQRSSFIIHHSSFTKALSGLILIGLIVYDLAFYMPIEVGVYQDYNFVSPKAQRLVQDAGLKNALVFVSFEPDWQWWKYGALFSANTPLLDSEVVYARDLGNASDARLMAYFPGRTYYRLTDELELVPMAGPGP